MYYPSSQIQTDLYSNGELLILITKESYIGSYYSTSTGKYFMGKSPNNAKGSIELIKYAKNPASNVAALEPDNDEDAPYYNYSLQTINYLRLKGITSIKAPSIPKYHYPTPTTQDYKVGEFSRYFCKKINESIFIEISVKDFVKLKNKDTTLLFNLYNPFLLTWVISGDKNKIAIENKNSVNYKELKGGCRGLSTYLKNNFTQFYSLYTSGGEFLLPNGKDYIGFYHIHPDKGPMAGIKHTLLPHSLLTPIGKTPSLESPSPIVPPSPNIYNGSSNTSGGY
jgi:hypothetical protein